MQFLRSLFFGIEGSYEICGTSVNFRKDCPSDIRPTSLDRLLTSQKDQSSLVAQIARKCINNTTFHIITQSYSHVFVHQIGHVFMYKLVAHKNSGVKIDSIVNIFTNRCASQVILLDEDKLQHWEKSLVNVAGSIGNIAYSTCKLVAIAAFKNYLPWPIALTLGSGSIIAIPVELATAYCSASTMDKGDFGLIARTSKKHLLLASAALISECVIGIFLVIRSFI